MAKSWSEFFSPQGLEFLNQNIALALAEDGAERTAEGVFALSDTLDATIIAKEDTFVVGLPIIALTLDQLNIQYSQKLLVAEGATVQALTPVATLHGQAIALLKAERVILNYICHLSGIANLTAQYVRALEGTGVRLLDTRKTTPGLRWPEKYAIQIGGGTNHRMDLTSMLMLKDNHIDAQGSIIHAVQTLRAHYHPCPPIEVECRTLDDVQNAVTSQCERIMLDNMAPEQIVQALALIPPTQECEISGGVTLESIRHLALLGQRHADYISVGRLTHSAKAADFSMRLSA
ncbi:MAG: carboxylating nicotinate-nucleotide diphosphorylase [Desulfovibrionaceae bacterium]|nr:carboxylating nicotinate-nucleotide diphosphorylase [Desulfovibrionaceae bacterium]